MKINKNRIDRFLGKLKENPTQEKLREFDKELFEKLVMKWEFRLEQINKTPVQLIRQGVPEFNTLTLDSTIKKTFAVLDEAPATDQIGFDSSTSEKQFEWQAGTNAVQGVCMLTVSPNNVYGRHCDLEFEVLDVDKNRFLTKTKNYYRYLGRPIFLGWNTFMIKDILKKYWYKDYMKKKLLAIEQYKQGNDTRKSEHALTVLLVIKKCEDLAKIGCHDTNITKNRINGVLREQGYPSASILSKDELVRQADGILGLISKVRERKMFLMNIPNKKISEEMKGILQKETEEQIKIIEEEITGIFQEHIHLIRNYIEYQSIGDSKEGDKIRNLCKKYQINLEEVTNGK